ncbi:MAG: hypothetical protein QMC93_02255 [Patescibacteria group bacterium]|nr:hypothetical protein [Patescibacteria group bacterium]
MNDINNLLKDVKDKFWRDRIKRSVETILSIYNLSLNEVLISREKVNPDELYVAAVEECSLEKTKKYLKPNLKIPPITVIQWRYKRVLFMGSNRAVKFVLQKRFPDCIIVKFPSNHVQPEFISEFKRSY